MYPDEIVNSVTKERIVFLETGDDTNGRYMKYEFYAQPNSPIAPEHFHPIAEERFEVKSGKVSYRINGKHVEGRPGDTMVIPSGTRHTGWNSGREELYLIGTISPALHFEDYYRNCFRLANLGKVNKKGMPGFLQLAAMGYELGGLMYLPRHVGLQKFFFRTIGPLAKMLGCKVAK